MSDDIVNIEVDGQPREAKKGQMIIEVTDNIGAYVPRFCYHQKLSIAANCRMCLVEVSGDRCTTRDNGIPADQSSARLPDLRPGR
jgi:NADH dehydrogenase/NADH:ubiquinone oxidoreductase subunit G